MPPVVLALPAVIFSGLALGGHAGGVTAVALEGGCGTAPAIRCSKNANSAARLVAAENGR